MSGPRREVWRICCHAPRGHRVGCQLAAQVVNATLSETLHPGCYQSERWRGLCRNSQAATQEATVLERGCGSRAGAFTCPPTVCFGVSRGRSRRDRSEKMAIRAQRVCQGLGCLEFSRVYYALSLLVSFLPSPCPFLCPCLTNLRVSIPALTGQHFGTK